MNISEKILNFLEAQSFSVNQIGNKIDKTYDYSYDVYWIQSWDPDAPGSLYLAVREFNGGYFYTAQFQVHGEAADIYFNAYGKTGRTIRINPVPDGSDSIEPCHIMTDWNVSRMSTTLRYLLKGIVGNPIWYTDYDGDIYSTLTDAE